MLTNSNYYCPTGLRKAIILDESVEEWWKIIFYCQRDWAYASCDLWDGFYSAAVCVSH